MNKPSPPALAHVASLHAIVEAPRNVARLASGMREMIVIAGGTVEGAINGKILPGGADWAVNHGGGKATIWARYAIECDDGSLVMVTNAGHVAEQPDGSWRGHTAPKLEASAPDLQWLNTAVLVGTLHAMNDAVELEWWRVV
jgi:Protein of unknown function (DUF3237)